MFGLILSGGYGKRLRPLTENIPKPLIKIFPGITLLEDKLCLLSRYGVKKFAMNSHYLHEKMLEFYEQHLQKNYDLIMLHEKYLLGSGGTILRFIRYLEDNDVNIRENVMQENVEREFYLPVDYYIAHNPKLSLKEAAKEGLIVINADIYMHNADLLPFFRFWDPTFMDVLALVYPKSGRFRHLGDGDIDTRGNFHFRTGGSFIWAGLYLVNLSKFALFKDEANPCSVIELIKKLPTDRVYAYYYQGEWDDLGVLEDLNKYLWRT